MCTIIGGFIKDSISNNDISLLNDLIRRKGGDYTEILYFSNGNLINIESRIETLAHQKRWTSFLIFSRLTPEMESSEVKIKQPYKTISGKYIAAHGTIPVSHEFDEIIDTEIFRFDLDIGVSIEKTNVLNGKVSLIEYNPELDTFAGVHNGLGLNLYENSNIKIITNIAISNDDIYIEPMRYTFLTMDYDIMSYHHYANYSDYIKSWYLKKNKDAAKLTIDDKIGKPRKPDAIISLCSGGMDIALSTYDVLYKYSREGNIPVELLYFNWNTVAKEVEIESVEKLCECFADAFDCNVEHKIINAHEAFKNLIDISGLESVRIQDQDAVGDGKNEAENAISYVPMRNTFLILMAAIYAEQKYPGKVVEFVLGANLTEGMVYLDNSTNYINKFNSLIRVAGQKTYNFRIAAPYANKTKTKMLELFAMNYSEIKLFEILRIAASCYFPVDGLPCGKCGSCLLRDKAISKYEANQKEKFGTNACEAGATVNESNQI